MLDEYPVYEHDIPRVNISAQKLEEWREVGHDEITRTLTHRNSWYFQFNEKTQDGYEQIADKDNLKAFARSVPNSQHKNVLIRASLETTLDAIVYGLYCETTYEQRCAFAHLYEDNFLDGAVLHVGKTKTREDPFRFVGMKWVAFRSPAPALVTSRDFIYFSYSGTMRDANGQRVLFRMLRSMPMDGVDVQERPNNNLVRGKISYLYLYRENGSRTEVSIQALHSTAGSMPSWAVTKTISFVWPGIFNLVTVAEAKVLMQNGMAGFHANAIFSSASSSGSSSHPGKSKSKSSSSAPANPSSCGVCFRRFRMMRSKRLCTGCHREMCKSCTTKLSFLDDRKQRSDTGVVPLRFCLNCMVKARTERVEITSHLLRDSVDIDLDDDFNALDISVYRETLKTKYLDADVLSDDDDDIDDIDDIDYIEPNFTSSRIKVHEDAGYSSGESYEGTSVMSSNLSF
uniref:FYVE-type domain-containing protein n=1 Tax=Globisporangium ultimum (strain ATCC 200006 / CBS 805.95 / DAOM BR144) TaxID=431595 RepID=K3WAG9_GLOUD